MKFINRYIMKSKFSASKARIASIKSFQNPTVIEINELADRLHLKEEVLKKAYEVAEKKEEVLEALKVAEAVKQRFADQVKELCNNLNDTGICITYIFAKKIGKDTLKFLSPYLLQKASDWEYIEQHIPKEYIKKSNQDDAMELLGKREVRDYLDQKSSELVSKSPILSTPSTKDTFNYDSDEITVAGEEKTTPNTE